MTTKLKDSEADLLPDVSEEDGKAWEKRNASVIKKQLAKARQDIQDGKGVVFDPRDPITFFENARKRYGKGKKAKA
jgi:hypothetical protein